jgi:hypothetical protein
MAFPLTILNGISQSKSFRELKKTYMTFSLTISHGITDRISFLES